MLDDTIAAIATPLGEGGLGVVRLSGPDALGVAGRVFFCSPPLAQASTHTLHHGRVMDGSETVDNAVAAVFRAPRSYTGEDVVEMSCHGSPALLKKVLSLCLTQGARTAEPGEYTRRAFLNGKMDLAQAEAVAALIHARSDAFRRMALAQLEGRLSRRLQELRKNLVGLLAHLEANTDFTEEEIPGLPRRELKERLHALVGSVRDLLATAPRARLWRDGIRVALIGRPNTGKSSLFNTLLGAERAIVTPVPGTTRDTLEETVMINDVPVTFIDTAGLRAHTGPVETEGIARARRTAETAQAVVVLLDLSAPPGTEDVEAVGLTKERLGFLAFNKRDLLGCDKWETVRRNFTQALPEEASRLPHAFLSATKGEGLKDFEEKLLGLFKSEGLAGAETPEAPGLIHDRHVELLRRVQESLETTLGRADELTDECLAVDLRLALGHLGMITGDNISEDVLEAIFAAFCIGK